MFWLIESGSSIVSPKTDEMELSGLIPLSSNLVNVPRVAETHINLECLHLKSVRVSSFEDKDRHLLYLVK